MKGTEEDLNELKTGYSTVYESKIVPLTDKYWNYLFTLCGQNLGLIRECLRHTVKRFSPIGNDSPDISTDKIISYIASMDVIYGVAVTSRNVPENNPTDPKQIKLLRDILFSGNRSVRVSLYEREVYKPLLYSGLIAITSGDSFIFPSPAIESVVLKRLFGRRQDNDSKFIKNGIINFSKEVVTRMKPSIFESSLGTSVDGTLYERQWQVEFYRAAVSALPSNCNISPDVGSVFDSKGYIDFYINHNVCWGIELLREGKGAAEHQRRFAKGGVYDPIPLKAFLIVDFRGNKPRKIDPNTLYVTYSSDYKSATFVYQTEQTIVRLLGDEVGDK